MWLLTKAALLICRYGSQHLEAGESHHMLSVGALCKLCLLPARQDN